MKKSLSYVLMTLIAISVFAGCGSNKNSSPATTNFVKPEKYAAIVNVQINPSFDLYLDDNVNVIAVEPKNTDAKELDFSNMIGLHLSAAMRNFMETISNKDYMNEETIVLVKFEEGEENITSVNVVEIIEDSCADAVAKETINDSMDSVLQAILEKEYGCDCIECVNWYERKYLYGEWEYKRAYNGYMASWKKHLEEMDKSDPQYELSSKSFEAMTFEAYMNGPAKTMFEAEHKGIEHKEKEVTYKILESVINPYNGSMYTKAEEMTAEEFLGKYLEDEDVGLIEGLQKGIYAPVEVYVNSEKQDGWYNLIAYECNSKWYVIDGTQQSFG